jgi:hypothetical protein
MFYQIHISHNEKFKLFMLLMVFITSCKTAKFEVFEVRRRAVKQELALESKVVDIFENSQIRDENIEETFWEKFWINLFSLISILLSQFDVKCTYYVSVPILLPMLLTGANWPYWQCDVEVAGAFTISHTKYQKEAFWRNFGGFLNLFVWNISGAFDFSPPLATDPNISDRICENS